MGSTAAFDGFDSFAIMPELPEVETTLRGIRPYLLGRTIVGVTVRERRLRQPIPTSFGTIGGCSVTDLDRRGKYLIARLSDTSHLLIHLGMSGSLRVTHDNAALRTHDHVILNLDSGHALRYHDPRRFGLMLHLIFPPESHPLLNKLGPEPLEPDFDSAYLLACCRGRKAAIKSVIMNSSVVVGVGNIYASEALFLSGIRPTTPAGRISLQRIERLVVAVKQVLGQSIAAGGTTLRDFLNADGNPGYFRQRLFVYQRAGDPCRTCGTAIRNRVLGQRATFWCPRCQR